MGFVIARFLKDERAAGLVEYGLLAALIAVMLVGVISVISAATVGLFELTADEVADAAPE